MRIALDTNILAYAEGVGDRPRCSKAIRLIDKLPVGLVVLPAQTLGELFNVLTRKAGRASKEARLAIISWSDSFDVADSSLTAIKSALDLTVDHQLQIWDALILAVAAENNCRLLLSEDMQNGFTWRGITIVNPFSAKKSPLLDRILKNAQAK